MNQEETIKALRKRVAELEYALSPCPRISRGEIRIRVVVTLPNGRDHIIQRRLFEQKWRDAYCSQGVIRSEFRTAADMAAESATKSLGLWPKRETVRWEK